MRNEILPFWAGWALVKCSWGSFSFCESWPRRRQHPLACFLCIRVFCLSFSLSLPEVWAALPLPLTSLTLHCPCQYLPRIHTEKRHWVQGTKNTLKKSQSWGYASSSSVLQSSACELKPLRLLVPLTHTQRLPISQWHWLALSLSPLLKLFPPLLPSSHPLPFFLPPLALSPPASFSIITPLPPHHNSSHPPKPPTAELICSWPGDWSPGC